jgi:hypothetical protein
MSAGKGDRARSNSSQQYRDNYDKIFGAKKLSPIKIFFDLDECVLHTEWGSAAIAESIGGIDDFVFDLGTKNRPELYRTTIRPGARECIAYAREQVGAENVYVLTASTEPYANAINTGCKLGFKREQIFHRQDIADCKREKDKYPDFRPCIMIDNLRYNDNMDKAYFLRIHSNDYQKVDEYYNDRTEDEYYNDRTEDQYFIDNVKAFIDRKVKYYNNPDNRD